MAKASKKSAKKKSRKSAGAAKQKKKKFLGSITKVAGLDHTIDIADGGQAYMLVSTVTPLGGGPVGPFPYSILC